MPRPALFACLLLVALPATAREVVRQRLGAFLFGEPVGEVRLTLTRDGDRSTLTYRSELRIVRDTVRLRQTAAIEVEYADRLLRSHARRCSAPEGEEPTCREPVSLSGDAIAGRLPSLAAELLLATGAPSQEHCLEVVDEESGEHGTACATLTAEPAGGRLLSGHKLGAPFRARVDTRGMLVLLELPNHGARFEAFDGELALSDADLYADPVPASGDVAAGMRRGRLRLRLTAPPEALDLLEKVRAPAQKMLERRGATALVQTRQARPPRDARSRRVLDAAALLVAQARGGHTDCQSATEWFLAKARARGWKARPAVGLAWVDGRFAFHAWALVDTPGGTVPVDPLLAQVPADAGHVQLADAGASAGSLLVTFRRGLSLEALPPGP